MEGFKKFLLRGNLVELAVAVIIGASFGDVVKSFTAVIMDIIGKFGGLDVDFSGFAPGNIRVGVFLTALIAFVILASIVYFGVVMPYEKAKEFLESKTKKAEEPEEVEAGPTTEALLVEIRDLLKKQ